MTSQNLKICTFQAPPEASAKGGAVRFLCDEAGAPWMAWKDTEM
jgi:hypothetical protein